jgi:ribonuclease R
MRLIHNKNGRIFQLEQPVTVSFAGVDDERRQINFKLVEAQEIASQSSTDGG